MKNFLLLAVCLSLASWGYAQQKELSGTVKDENGEILPGVNVVAKGTTTGTVTDMEGNFKLSVDAGVTELVFSFVGMETQTVAIGDQTQIEVRMKEDNQTLSDVVVTGLGGELNRRALTTTVDKVTAEDLEATPIVRMDQLLQSKLPNTQILMSSGAPGATSVIRSRGISSALLGQQPVVYVDGVRVDNLNTAPGLSVATGGQQSSALADIPVDQIKDIQFLKGGAATTLYGSDAANGVLIITTNKGKAGKAAFTYEAQIGAIEGTGDYFVYDETKDLAFRTGFLNSHRLGVSGGSEHVTYNFFARFRDDNSFQPGLEENRYSAGGGFSAAINKKLHYAGSFAYTHNRFQTLPNANSSFDRVFGIETGTTGPAAGLSEADPTQWSDAAKDTVRNFLDQIAELADVTTKVYRFTNSHSLTYDVLDNLQIKATLGFDYRFSRNEDVTTNEYLVAQGFVAPGTTTEGSIDRADRSYLATTGNFVASHNATVSDFTFNTTAGGQFFNTSDNQTQVVTTNQAETSTSVNIAADQSVADFQLSVVNYGFFVQEVVGFKEKAFLNLGFRNDYNTAFGKDVLSQFYPKIGASYVLSAEPFWGSIEPIVSTFKARISYGEAGNFPIPFTRDAQLNANPFLGQLAFQPGQPGDANLAPERLRTLEYGADIGFIKNRINFEFTIYRSTTEDALFTAPFASSTGQEAQSRNLGEIQNRGVELAGRFHIIRKRDFSVSLNASANFQKNEVVSSGGSSEFNIGGFTFLGPFVKEGLPVGYLRGNNPTFDAEGNVTDVEFNANLGKALPDMFGSLSLNATYKDFSLYIAGDYQAGAQGVNTDEVLRFFRGLDDDRIPENAKSESFFNLAGVWVEDTDFFKIRNITLTYHVPSEILDKIGAVKRASVSFTALNPINVFSSVFDPEITGAGARSTLPGTNTTSQGLVTVGGFGYGTVSAPRQFLGTFRFSF